jgi:hypothetical protein
MWAWELEWTGSESVPVANFNDYDNILVYLLLIYAAYSSTLKTDALPKGQRTTATVYDVTSQNIVHFIVTALRTSICKKYFYPDERSSTSHCPHRTHLEDCVRVWTLVQLDVESLLWFITRFYPKSSQSLYLLEDCILSEPRGSRSQQLRPWETKICFS